MTAGWLTNEAPSTMPYGKYGCPLNSTIRRKWSTLLSGTPASFRRVTVTARAPNTLPSLRTSFTVSGFAPHPSVPTSAASTVSGDGRSSRAMVLPSRVSRASAMLVRAAGARSRTTLTRTVGSRE